MTQGKTVSPARVISSSSSSSSSTASTKAPTITFVGSAPRVDRETDDNCNTMAWWRELISTLTPGTKCNLLDVRPFELTPAEIVRHVDNEPLDKPLADLVNDARLIAQRRVRKPSTSSTDNDDADNDTDNIEPANNNVPSSSTTTASTSTRHRHQQPCVVNSASTRHSYYYYTPMIRNYEAELLRRLMYLWW